MHATNVRHSFRHGITWQKYIFFPLFNTMVLLPKTQKLKKWSRLKQLNRCPNVIKLTFRISHLYLKLFILTVVRLTGCFQFQSWVRSSKSLVKMAAANEESIYSWQNYQWITLLLGHWFWQGTLTKVLFTLFSLSWSFFFGHGKWQMTYYPSVDTF